MKEINSNIQSDQEQAKQFPHSSETPSIVTEISDPAAMPTLGAWINDRQLSVFVLVSLTAGALYLTYLIFRPFLAALFVALIMSITFFPLHRWVRRRISNSYLAALITTLAAILFILVPVALVTARVAVEITTFAGSFIQESGVRDSWPHRMDSLVERVSEEMGVPAEQVKSGISNKSRELGRGLIALASSIAQRFFRQMMTVLLGSVFLFSILRHSDELRIGALSLLPLSPQRARELATAVNEGVIANVYGMFAVGIGEGILIALGFWLTGLPSPLLWGVVATVLSCLPVVGVSLVWVPGCIVLALRGNWTYAILLFFWGLVVVSTSDGILRCHVVSGRVKVNSLLITLSLMGGLAVFGAIGFFVGPVVVVLLGSLIRILREEHASVHESKIRAA